MISVRDLTFSYDAKPVLEHLSFSVPEDVIDEALMEALYGVSVQFEDTSCGRIIMAASGHK